MSIKEISTEADIRACYETYQHLRPHLSEEDFVAQAMRQMQDVGFRILAIEEQGNFVSAVGFRMQEYLAWGKIIYIDDLVTHPNGRGKGYGSQLLQAVKAIAIDNNCDAVHLDSGYQRHDAHRVYLNNGYILASHHFSLSLD